MIRMSKARIFISAMALIFLASGCSTTRTIEGRSFHIHQKEDDGKRDFGQVAPQSERGFLAVEKNIPICNGNNKVTGGYFVHLQPIKKGQSESERKEYVAAEGFRVQQCTKLALSCATTANKRCRQDDDPCLKENKRLQESTCRYFPTDEDRKRVPGIKWISDSSGAAGVSHDILLCADRNADFVSPLYFATHTNQAWKKDLKQWEALCRRFKTSDQCDELLKAEGPSAQYATEHDMTYSKWAVEILAGDTVKVQDSNNGSELWGEVQIDVSPACDLMDGRH